MTCIHVCYSNQTVSMWHSVQNTALSRVSALILHCIGPVDQWITNFTCPPWQHGDSSMVQHQTYDPKPKAMGMSPYRRSFFSRVYQLCADSHFSIHFHPCVKNPSGNIALIHVYTIKDPSNSAKKQLLWTIHRYTCLQPIVNSTCDLGHSNHKLVHSCMVCTEHAPRWLQFHVAPNSTAKYTTLMDIQKCAMNDYKRLQSFI